VETISSHKFGKNEEQAQCIHLSKLMATWGSAFAFDWKENVIPLIKGYPTLMKLLPNEGTICFSIIVLSSF
jgi:hypothetical protein